jgi:hypothetical protein
MQASARQQETRRLKALGIFTPNQGVRWVKAHRVQAGSQQIAQLVRRHFPIVSETVRRIQEGGSRGKRQYGTWPQNAQTAQQVSK